MFIQIDEVEGPISSSCGNDVDCFGTDESCCIRGEIDGSKKSVADSRHGNVESIVREVVVICESI